MYNRMSGCVRKCDRSGVNYHTASQTGNPAVGLQCQIEYVSKATQVRSASPRFASLGSAQLSLFISALCWWLLLIVIFIVVAVVYRV